MREPCGYARVSTDGQSVEAQVTALRAVGAEKVFREVASGAKKPPARSPPLPHARSGPPRRPRKRCCLSATRQSQQNAPWLSLDDAWGRPRVHASSRSGSGARPTTTRLGLETGIFLSANKALKLPDF